MEADVFNVFGDDFDRFDFPGNIHRVTAGNGGEVLLIIGSEKTAVIDCGMAYCGKGMIRNLREKLAEEGRETLDYALLTHSHYDHMGALPYIREAFPDVVIYASKHCRDILVRPNAKALMKELGTAARELYMPESDEEIPVNDLEVDIALQDGDEISLGDEKVIALETKGHTDCSMSFVLEPVGIIFTSESTGIVEVGFQINTPILKSFDDAFKSLEKCRNYGAEYVCLPHFGLIPKDFNEKYWQLFYDECKEKIRMVRAMKSQGLTNDEMLQKFKDKIWNPVMEQEQPVEAFLINMKNVIKAALKAV